VVGAGKVENVVILAEPPAHVSDPRGATAVHPGLRRWKGRNSALFEIQIALRFASLPREALRSRSVEVGARRVKLYGRCRSARKASEFRPWRKIHTSESLPDVRVVLRNRQDLDVFLFRSHELAGPCKNAGLPCPYVQVLWCTTEFPIKNAQSGVPLMGTGVVANFLSPIRSLNLTKDGKSQRQGP